MAQVQVRNETSIDQLRSLIFFFRIHFSARAGKAMHSRQQQDIPLLDRIDVIPAHDWPKHASLHVNCLDDVVAR
jgi:hypothetical protein